MYENIYDFYNQLYTEIISESRVEGEERFAEEVYVEKMINFLHETNTLENGVLCRHRSRGLKVDGYDVNSTGNSIDLLVAHFIDDSSYIPKLGKTEIKTAFKRARIFLEKSLIGTGMREVLDESSHEVLDLANLIHNNFKNLKSSRIILLTNGFTGNQPAIIEKLGNIEITFQVWDFERLWQSVSSGMKKEVITLEFLEEGYQPIPTIYENDGKGLYTTYIGIIPGQLLRDLYDKYGTRLLERNVRAFLQARSKVNQGIRDTIIQSPNMFLAYNNGITVTAQSVSIVEDENNIKYLKTIKDFQVVNGGQTIASLWHTSTKNRANLKNVNLLMKLTVVNDPDLVDEIAPKISKYSNAQNKVNTADFSANTPFHINLEKISQSVWAPDPEGGNINTKWFYERSRGSFYETRALERTSAKIRAWDIRHPKHQKFDKLVLAKIMNTWRQMPQIVSLGGQKCFSHFTVYLEELIENDNEIEVNEKFFQELISKIVIWKSAEKIVTKQKIPGYRANIVTYSISWILAHNPELFDYKEIWTKQAIDDNLHKIINNIAFAVRDSITDTEGNVTEWCKKEACWENVKKLDINYNEGYDVQKAEKKQNTKKNTKTIDWSIFEKPQNWVKLSDWIESSKILPEKDAKFSRSLATQLFNGRNPSFKQIPIAFKIMENAIDNGFIE